VNPPESELRHTTVLVTGPTRGLGRETALRLARHPDRPGLLLLGRPGPALDSAAADCRRAGADVVHAVAMDQADLASVRAAATRVEEILSSQKLELCSIVANAGIQTVDLHHRTRDGFELTFGVNVLGTHLLLQELSPLLAQGGRVVLVGSGTAEDRRKDGLVPVPVWEDPVLLAQPDRTHDDPDDLTAGRRAYSTSKLGTLYLAHAHQRHTRRDHQVDVFDPGMMPGTGLARDASLVQRVGWNLLRAVARWAPGMSTPRRSAVTLAAMAMGELGSSGGRYVHIDLDVDPSPTAFDEEREERLWDAAEQLTSRA